MVYSDCPICLSGSEDIKHMIFMCDRAKSVWQLLLFLPNLPSPLLCFADDEIIQVHTLYGI